MTTIKTVLFAIFISSLSAYSQKHIPITKHHSGFFTKQNHTSSKKEISSNHEDIKFRIKNRHYLSSYFTITKNQNPDYRLLQSYFKKNKQQENKRSEEPDFYLKQTDERKARFQQDAFIATKKSKKHSEKEVTNSFKHKKIKRKKFIGEPPSIISKRPRKAINRLKKQSDTFGVTRKNQRANTPRGEKDLFESGVLPKMSDTR